MTIWHHFGFPHAVSFVNSSGHLDQDGMPLSASRSVKRLKGKLLLGKKRVDNLTARTIWKMSRLCCLLSSLFHCGFFLECWMLMIHLCVQLSVLQGSKEGWHPQYFSTAPPYRKVSTRFMMSKPDPTFQVTLSGTPTSNSALPQPWVMPGPGQVMPLPQGESQEQADQEIYIMILPGIQDPQEKKLKTEEQDRTTRLLRTNLSNSTLSRPKTRVAAKRGHTASSASGIPGGGGGGRLGAIKENVINAHCYPAGISLTRPAEGKKALQTLQAVSTHSGASLITPHSQKSGAEQAPQEGAVQALAARTLGPTQQQVSVNAVSVPDSPSSKLSTSHSVGLQSPVAASTPLLHCKQLALRPLASEVCAQDSPGNNFRPVSTSSSSDLQQDCAQPVLSLDHFSSPILPWSDVSMSQAPSVNTANSVSTSTPVSKTKSSGLGSHLLSTAQPEASVLNLSSSVNSEELLGTLFTHESAEAPSSSQLPTFSQSSTEQCPAPSMEFQHEEAQDSGIGASLGSVALTSGSTGVESDFGATCSSWATSEDSNQMVIDFNVDSLSQGSTEDNSNSQGNVMILFFCNSLEH